MIQYKSRRSSRPSAKCVYSKPSKANEESNFAIKTRMGLVSEPIKQTDLGNMDSSTVINQSTDHGIAVANSIFQENFGSQWLIT